MQETHNQQRIPYLNGFEQVPWTAWSAIKATMWSVVLVVLCQFVFVISVMVWSALLGWGSSYGITMTEFVLESDVWIDINMTLQLVLFLAMAHVFVFRTHEVRWSTFVPRETAARDVRSALRFTLACIGALTVVVCLVLLAIFIIALLSGREWQTLQEGFLEGRLREQERLPVPTGNWFRVGLMVLLAPIAEELLFRGGLYAALRRRRPAWQANLLSSTVFAVLHGYVFSLGDVLVIGVMSAVVYERTRSLRASIIFHMYWNAMAAAQAMQSWVFGISVLMIGVIGYWWSGRQLVRSSTGIATGGNAPAGWLKWKVYAWLFGVLMVTSYLGNGNEDWWQVLIQLPLVLCVLWYAYRRPRGPIAWWRAYAAVYVVKSSWDILSGFAPGATLERQLQQAATSPEALNAMALELMITLAMSIGFWIPALVVLLRASDLPGVRPFLTRENLLIEPSPPKGQPVRCI